VVVGLLERLDDGEAVEAMSIERSETFRRAVQLCLSHVCIKVDRFHVLARRLT